MSEMTMTTDRRDEALPERWSAQRKTEVVLDVDRSGPRHRDSTPHRSPERTSPRQVAAIVALRTQGGPLRVQVPLLTHFFARDSRALHVSVSVS